MARYCGCAEPVGSLADELWDGTCRRCGGLVELGVGMPADVSAALTEDYSAEGRAALDKARSAKGGSK